MRFIIGDSPTWAKGSGVYDVSERGSQVRRIPVRLTKRYNGTIGFGVVLSDTNFLEGCAS
jgi:hypothetical protein